MSEKDLFGLGLAVAGGFLLGKTFKKDNEEVEYLKKERERLMSERDDIIYELEVATQEDYVSPEDRYEDEYEEDEYEEDTEDDVDVQQRRRQNRSTQQHSEHYICDTVDVASDIQESCYRENLECNVYEKKMFGTYMPHIEIIGDPSKIKKVIRGFKSVTKRVNN